MFFLKKKKKEEGKPGLKLFFSYLVYRRKWRERKKKPYVEHTKFFIFSGGKKMWDKLLVCSLSVPPSLIILGREKIVCESYTFTFFSLSFLFIPFQTMKNYVFFSFPFLILLSILVQLNQTCICDFSFLKMIIIIFSIDMKIDIFHTKKIDIFFFGSWVSFASIAKTKETRSS